MYGSEMMKHFMQQNGKSRVVTIPKMLLCSLEGELSGKSE